ncbi:PHO85 cyclin-1 [Coemansia spiralis]|nr:PHO85 cyclin-1 [Coemansia spiralis]
MASQVEATRPAVAAAAARVLHTTMAAPLTSRTLDTIQCEITKDMIAVIAIHARNVIPCTPVPALSGSTTAASSGSQQTRLSSAERLPSPPTTPGAALSLVPPLDMFITNLVLRSRVQAGTLVCTLVYLQRLRNRLPKEARGMECTCHRIFLATLIVAGKYLNDASPKNKYWARYSTVFTVAEVNLMEKQLLFLLDFDLRIDNADLNEAASAFFAPEPTPAGPLTPTTPPTTAQHSQYHTHKGHHASEAARIYPPNLGLPRHNGGPPDADVAAATAASAADAHSSTARRATHQPLSTCGSATTAVPGAPQPDTGRRQVSCGHHDGPRCRSAVHKTVSSNPLRAIPADEMLGPRPSPKKRAVSRGHHSNVPHPSPVYHCHSTSAQSAASSLAAAMAPSSSLTTATAQSACFLQPLEDAGGKYSLSRFQQQRYDPRAVSGTGAAGERPRASVSIPSLRGVGARPVAAGCSPAGTKASSNTGARPPKSRHILRHQSTLPDFHHLDTAALGGRDWLSSSRAASTYLHPALPLPPPPAHLAGATDHLEYSPVNTLVYEQSPAAATVGRSDGARRMGRQSSRLLDGNEYDVDRTLSYAQDGSASVYGAAAPPLVLQPPQDPCDGHAYQSGPHFSKSSGSGWQLKTKILHPLSTWFRSSRHQSADSHAVTVGPALPVAAAGSLARSTRNPLAGACPAPTGDLRTGSA